MRIPVKIVCVLFVALFLAAGCAPAAQNPPAAATSAVPATSIAATATSPATAPPSTATASVISTAAPVANGAGAQVPSSCSAIASLVGSYMGGVGTTKSLGSPGHLSCQFINANATTVVIVNIGGGGTAAMFDTLRATSGQGGRTITPIGGLGISAFSVSKNNVPAGLAVFTAQGLIYSLTTNLSLAQDEALIQQLMQLH